MQQQHHSQQGFSTMLFSIGGPWRFEDRGETVSQGCTCTVETRAIHSTTTWSQGWVGSSSLQTRKYCTKLARSAHGACFSVGRIFYTTTARARLPDPNTITHHYSVTCSSQILSTATQCSVLNSRQNGSRASTLRCTDSSNNTKLWKECCAARLTRQLVL